MTKLYYLYDLHDMRPITRAHPNLTHTQALGFRVLGRRNFPINSDGDELPGSDPRFHIVHSYRHGFRVIDKVDPTAYDEEFHELQLKVIELDDMFVVLPRRTPEALRRDKTQD